MRIGFFQEIDYLSKLNILSDHIPANLIVSVESKAFFIQSPQLGNENFADLSDHIPPNHIVSVESKAFSIQSRHLGNDIFTDLFLCYLLRNTDDFFGHQCFCLHKGNFNFIFERAGSGTFSVISLRAVLRLMRFLCLRFIRYSPVQWYLKLLEDDRRRRRLMIEFRNNRILVVYLIVSTPRRILLLESGKGKFKMELI